MTRPVKHQPARPTVGAIHDDEPPPAGPAAAALRLSKAQRLATARAALRLVENKPARPVPTGPYARGQEERREAARRLRAEAQLRAWESAGFEAIWERDGEMVQGTWLEAPAPSPEVQAYAIRGNDGALSRAAIRFVSRWLAHCAAMQAAEEQVDEQPWLEEAA